MLFKIQIILMYNVSKSESSIYFLYKDQSKKAQKEYFIKFLNFVSKLLSKDFFFDTRKNLNLRSIINVFYKRKLFVYYKFCITYLKQNLSKNGWYYKLLIYVLINLIYMDYFFKFYYLDS